MLENFQGDSWGSIPPLSMPSLLPQDLCQGQSSLPASPPFLFLQIARCSSVPSFWMFCRRILKIRGRTIMRSKIKAPAATYPRILDRMFFPEMKLEKVWKKSLAAPAAVKSSWECSRVYIWLWSFPKSRPMSELFQTTEIWFLIFSHS